ncbi:RagB/SusD family nutrient uptake outer membrane protein [Prolixibacteraceae bacterium JC049]|nr:RagB/SusD family nutrient uptake outer membrane protein [Prolixibacteraceae bacterium JC049]
MKKIYNLISLVIIVLLLGACSESFLEEKSPDKLTSGNYWRDKADAESGLAAAYSQLEGFVGWDPWQEGRPVVEYYRSDLIVPGADAFNYSWWTDLYNFSYTKGNYAIYLIWKYNYRGLNYANQVIEKVGEMDESKISAADKKQIVAEATFLRAYYHFKLLSHFSEIIIRDKAPAGNADLAKGLSPREEAWDFIIADLKAAADDLILQHDGNNIGRATSGAANAYLGRAYMYRAGEDAGNASTYIEEAGKALKKVIDSGVYSLTEDFLGMFNGSNENSSESIFELQLSPVKDNGAKYDMWFQYFVGANEFGFWEEILGTPELLTEMKKEGKIADGGNYDSRLYETVFFDDEYFNDEANPRVYGSTWKSRFGENNSKITFRKYIPDVASKFTDRSAINHPLMRYADVLLLYAEVLNETGSTGDAIGYINQVRDKHGDMPAMTGTTKEEVKQQIIHERVMEFTLECARFMDLRRWGMLAGRMQATGRNGFDAAKHSYLPIPEDEVKTNPAID